MLYAPIQQVASRQARRHAPNPKRILDVGCGGGRLLRSMRIQHPQAILAGVDIDAGMLAVAAHLQPGRARLVQAAAERLPLADRTIDLAFALMSLRHWNDVDVALGEINRVLAPGGTFILADSAVVDGPSRTGRWPGRSPGREIARLLTAHGMRLLDQDTVPAQATVPEVYVLAARPKRSPNPA